MWYDDFPLAQAVIIRTAELSDSLDLAQVSKEFRSGIHLEITFDEAVELIKAADGSGLFPIRYLVETGTRDANGTPWYRTKEITLLQMNTAGPPVRGRPWAYLCGFPLVWFGK